LETSTPLNRPNTETEQRNGYEENEESNQAAEQGEEIGGDHATRQANP